MVNVEGYKVGLEAFALMQHFNFLVIHEKEIISHFYSAYFCVCEIYT